ncbi:MAG: RnfABCDGE type electron transport complex subunit B [Tissierellia bacterium]|nr:RnfABCDGE type electron transport complex subunit B [Tissierellia bacterium]
MSAIIEPIGILGGLGLLFGIGLSMASQVFHVESDPKVDKIRAALPGVNCGACGYPGCEGLAVGIADGEASVTACSVGGSMVAERIASIMGVAAGEVEKQVAVVLCQGDCEHAEDRYIYHGIEDCRAEDALAGGSKACTYGCLGCGTCQDVCDFDAISIVDGIAIIDREKCTGCELCVAICPKKLIEMVPYEQDVIVKCKSEEAGRFVRRKCTVGCIGCSICVKNCPDDAFIFENLLARIDYDKCTNCGICVEKCPTKSIWSGIEEVEQIAQ